MRQLEFIVSEGAPVQLLTDGIRHVLITDPSMQVTGWSLDGDTVRLTTVGGDPSLVSLPIGGGAITVNEKPICV